MKDQFLFVYSLLVIHTQQVFYSHKKPNNKRVNSSTVSGKDNNCTYLYTYYTYYNYYVNPIYSTSKYQSNLNTNPIQSIYQTNPIQHPIQSNPIQSNIQFIQSNSLKPCGKSIHNTNNTLTSSIITLFHQISIHQSNPIIKYSICIIIQDTTII